MHHENAVPLKIVSSTNALRRRSSLGLSAAVAGWLLLVSPRLARAENSVSYKYEDYREANGRVAVQSQGALLDQDFGPVTHLKLQGVIDAITGATPSGQPAPAGSDQVVLKPMDDRRKAWSADLSRQFAGMNVVLGYANSRESDYVSDGWSINTLTDFNQKNTTLLAGLAGTSDSIKVFFQPNWAGKRTRDLIVGVTQLLNPRTSVSLNLTLGRATGYLNDPYKQVQKRVEVHPGDFLNLVFDENRPDTRNKWIALASVNHAFPTLHAALEASYRFYHDSFGTNAHTIELAWFQQVGRHFVLRPGIRWYDQSAADFYYYNLDVTAIVPPFSPPTARAPFYSSDYRLSALRTFTYGVKAIWTISDRAQIDAAFEQYDMRGNDGVTSPSAYPRASIVTAGLKLSW